MLAFRLLFMTLWARTRLNKMGVKSTKDITRSQALHFITDAMYEVDNVTLARLVEEINDYLERKGDYENSLGLHNFYITE